MPPTSEPQRLTARRRRLVRFRQGLALALVVAAVAVAGIYLVRRRAQRLDASRRPELHPPTLGLTIQQSAQGVTIAKSESGRPIFRVFAQRAEKLRPGGRDVLHQVKILVYAADGVHADQIAGDEFAYDEASGALTARGAVHIVLQGRPDQPSAPEAVEVEAHDLAYNVKQGTGSIAQGITFRYGTARGQAGAAQLDSHQGLATFSGGVAVTWHRPGQPDLTLASQQASLRRLPKASSDALLATLAGPASVVAGAQTLRADQLVFYLRRDQTLRHLDALGHVFASDALPGRPLAVQADRAHADFTTAKRATLAHLSLAGHVLARQTTAQGQNQLAAGEVEALFTPRHDLDQVQARQNAVLSLAGKQPQRLAAPELDFHFRQAAAAAATLPASHARLAAISTQGRARLDGAVHAQADHLRLDLDPSQQPALAVATGDVQVRQTVGAQQRTSRSQSLELQFAPAPGAPRGQAQLRQATESGGVELQQGDRQLWADQVVYRPSDRTAMFSGAVRASDPLSRFTAPAVTWVSRPDGGSDLSATGGVTVSFLASAAAPGRAPTPAALPGPMLNPGQPVVVTAASLHWDEPPPPRASAPSRTIPSLAPSSFRGIATFSGAVRVIQAPNLLRADRLTVNGAASTLVANGQVETDFLTSGAARLPQVGPKPSAAKAKRSADLGPRGPRVGVSTSGTRAVGAQGPAPTKAKRSADLGPRGPRVGVSTSGTRTVGALGPAPTMAPQAVTIAAGELRYSAPLRQAVYLDHVRMRLADGTLTAPRLVVSLRPAAAGKSTPAGLQRALATGGVHLAQPGRSATARQVSYDFAQGVIQLTGGPPSILDAEQGKITGDPLTFSLSSDEIQVGSKLGTRATGQTTAHN
ncbi:MAG TPA: hypothetical protein VMV31_02880 [Terriglobales bacterium]|nr:hypothetical protein [Terriglobales bacterium]